MQRIDHLVHGPNLAFEATDAATVMADRTWTAGRPQVVEDAGVQRKLLRHVGAFIGQTTDQVLRLKKISGIGSVAQHRPEITDLDSELLGYPCSRSKGS
jgi:hypothetical protein